LGNNVRNNGIGGSSSLTAKLNGHLAVANLGADVVAVDGLRPDRGTDALLWRQDLGQENINNNFSNGFSRGGLGNANPLMGPQPDTSGRLRQSTGPLTSGGVCFQRGRQIICVDPLSGQSLWERASTQQAEIPQQAHLFGDDELLFVADARADSKQDEALVLSAIDGQLLGKRKVEQPDRRWATHGRRVLGIETANSIVNLRLYDAWEPKNSLWTKRLASGSRGFLVESEELALLEASGQFTMISLADGKLRFSVPLEAEPSLTWIQVIRSRDQYLLLASQESTAMNSALNMGQSFPQRSMHGRTYAFDRETGKLQWQSPAFVSHHALPVDQPTESPLLVFVASRHLNNKLSTNVLVLDRRTGRNVYEKDLAGSFNSSDIFVDPAKDTATISLFGQPNRSIHFQMTANPLAPEPPAQTGEMASAAASRRAGNVDITLGDAIELLRNSPRNLFPPAPGAPIVVPPQARPR
jgi:outer membrane protein assembly factor BamB